MKVQYLRLYIVDNHGGNSICFQGMQLHGADCQVFDVLRSCQQQELADSFVEKVDLVPLSRLMIMLIIFH